MTTQNLLDAAKSVLRGKFIAIQTLIKKINKKQGKMTHKKENYRPIENRIQQHIK